MKRIDSSYIDSSKKQGFVKGTFKHYDEAMVEGFDALLQAMLQGGYSASDVYILWGCVNSGNSSGAGLTFNVSAGAVFYNGEYYLVDAFSGVFVGTNVIVGSVATTYRAGDGDPAPFTDGVTRNVHKINKWVLSQGASGSGTKDHTDLKKPFVKYVNSVTDDTNTFQIDYTNYPAYAVMTGFTFTTPNDGKTRNLLIQFKAHAVSDGTGNANGALASVRLRNTTAGANLDFTEYRMHNALATNGSSNSLCLFYYGAVAPNTTIRIELQGYSGYNYVRLSKSKLFVAEQTVL